MNEEEELSHILNSKLSGEEVPFDEENWEEAEQLIENSRKKERRRRWAFIYLIGLVSGILIMLPFILKMGDNSAKSTDKPKVKENKEISVTNNQTGITPKQKDSGMANSMDNGAQPKTVSLTGANQNTYVKADKPVSVAANKYSNLITVEKNKPVATNAKHVAIEKPKPAQPLPVALKEAKTKVVKESKTASDSNVSVYRNKQAASTVTMTTEESMNSDKKDNMAKDTSNTLKKEDEIIAVNPAVVKDITHPGNNQNKTATGGNILQTVAEAKHDSNNAMKKDSVTTNPGTVTVQPQPANEKATPKNVFSVVAGTNYCLGWSYGGIAEGRGFNPLAGLGLTHLFNSKWALYIGADYNSIGYLTSSTYKASHADNGFGYNATDTSITTKWLYYVMVPIQVQYKLNEKSYIGIGGSASHLITSSGTMTTYSQSDYATINQKTLMQTGYYKGFNTWNASVMALYGRRISGRLSIIGEIYYGLIDIKDNSFFGVQKFENDSGLKILLSYDIF